MISSLNFKVREINPKPMRKKVADNIRSHCKRMRSLAIQGSLSGPAGMDFQSVGESRKKPDWETLFLYAVHPECAADKKQ